MKIVIFGGSFNPPGKHHQKIARELMYLFDVVIIVPCGKRCDKLSTNVIPIEHRKEMAKIAFSKMLKCRLDLYDLENNVYTPTYFLQKKYQKEFPGAEIWHFVGSDILIGGRDQRSEIHRVWDRGKEVWQNLNFLVNIRPGYKISSADLPPHSELVKFKDARSATKIRQRIKQDKSFTNLVVPKVADYIEKNRLYDY